MKFPYGISDFYKIITQNYFYVDRTDRIRLIEAAGEHLLFLRPRRFGKSLLLSMLENYYDLARAEEFQTLFGALSIGQNPTSLHHQYFVLKWDFSMVDPQGEVWEIKQSLHHHLNGRMADFAAYYQSFLPRPIEIDETDALHTFQSLLTAVRLTPYRLYLLIDEYDNFANEVLMGRPLTEGSYQELLYGEGTLKTLFKVVKGAAAGLGLDRVFITGVSPIVLSDITSGYNVAKNIYLKPEFNDLCGFWESEIQDTLNQIVTDCGLPETKAAEALMMMRTFYNGYCFSYDEATFVYNPTLALYFMENLQERCQYPRQMLDINLAMGRDKLRYISQLPGGGQLLLDVVNERQPLSISQFVDRFGVEEMLTASKDTPFMASLLYYFGVLTLGGISPLGELILKVPNLVVRKLYLEQIQRMLLPAVEDKNEALQAAKTFYSTGDLQPVCDFVEQRYFKVFDNRDYRWANELTVKTAFLTLLFNDVFYIIDSETSLERTYADLTMILRPEMRRYRLLDLLLEFKYISLAEAGLSGARLQSLSREALQKLGAVQQKLAEAQLNLASYRQILEATYGELLRLRCYAVVSLGFERLVWVEVGSGPEEAGDAH